MMDQPVVHNETDRQFEIEIEHGKAVLIYRYFKKSIVLMHTIVPKEAEHRGIGTHLAETAFRYAAESDRLVRVYCPFVWDFVQHHPEYTRQLDTTYHTG